MSQEKQLIDLEIRLTYQESHLDQLSEEVYQQQLEIQKLVKRCESLESNLNSDGGEGLVDRGRNEKPPHY